MFSFNEFLAISRFRNDFVAPVSINSYSFNSEIEINKQ